MDLIKTTVSLALALTIAIIGAAYFFAGEAIRAAAPIIVWTFAGVIIASTLGALAIAAVIGWLFIRNYRARKYSDYTAAKNEAKTSDLDFERNRLHFDFERLALGSQAVQMAQGLVFATSLGEAAFGSHVAAVAKLIQKNDSAYLESPAPTLPELVKIEDHVQPDNVSLSRLFLGIGAGNETIRGSLKELSHVGIAGTSRWGKSIFIQCLLYQILLAKEKTELYLSDIGGTSFIDLGRPYADDVATTERLAAQLWEATMDRKAKYQATGQGVRSLDMYNSLTGDDLPSIIFAADETTVLMGQSKALTKHLMNLVSYAGKYGIFLLLAGQNWKSVSVPSEIRDQFSSRFQFKSMDHRQASILIPGSEAQDITIKGRCAAWIPEVGKTIQIQTPLIEPATLQAIAQPAHALLGDKLPLWDIEPEPETNDRAAEIRKLSADGMSKTAIANHFGYKSNSGAIYYEIKSALENSD